MTAAPHPAAPHPDPFIRTPWLAGLPPDDRLAELMARGLDANGVRLRPLGRYPRVVNVVEKPAALRARMARALLDLALAGAATAPALRLRGFTDADIADHAGPALAMVRAAYPDLERMENDP